MFAGSVCALLHNVQSVMLVCLQAPSSTATRCPVCGVGVFAGSIYALLPRVQSVVLVCLQAPYASCYSVSSQCCWCVCWLRLRSATHRQVSGVDVFACYVFALLHSVQSVVLMCLLAPSTPCYTVSGQWC